MRKYDMILLHPIGNYFSNISLLIIDFIS